MTGEGCVGFLQLNTIYWGKYGDGMSVEKDAQISFTVLQKKTFDKLSTSLKNFWFG